jgi:hypothetical protein
VFYATDCCNILRYIEKTGLLLALIEFDASLSSKNENLSLAEKGLNYKNSRPCSKK